MFRFLANLFKEKAPYYYLVVLKWTDETGKETPEYIRIASTLRMDAFEAFIRQAVRVPQKEKRSVQLVEIFKSERYYPELEFKKSPFQSCMVQ